MAIMEHSSALDENNPMRMKGVNKYLQPQGSYTFRAPTLNLSDNQAIQLHKDGNYVNKAIFHDVPNDCHVPRYSNHATQQPQSFKDDQHTLRGQKLQSTHEGFALPGFSKTDVAAQGPAMPLSAGNKRIPPNLLDSFILADTGPKAPIFEYPQPSAFSAIAGAFDHAHADTLQLPDHHGHTMSFGSYCLSAHHPSVVINDEYCHAAEHSTGSYNYVLSAFMEPLGTAIPAAAPNVAAPKATTKLDHDIDRDGNYNTAGDSSSSTTSDTPSTSNGGVNNADAEQNDSDIGEDNGEETSENSGQESSGGDSSDDESSDDSSDEDDDAIPGLARVRALNLSPALSFTRDGRTRWPCNQCQGNWSRRDETHRHLRRVHYASLYPQGFPLRKGLEQARIDSP
ncbi:hypothetical protein LY78DRAFT_678277 [Colletotrichum sublineola]|nr:hypothetical protein LY78DRAFT_678277 [Colletotrichum sublineola]